MNPTALFLIAITAFASDALADVITVGPQAHYETIQGGVDAAFPGDLILVQPGIYSSTVIDGKGISLLA